MRRLNVTEGLLFVVLWGGNGARAEEGEGGGDEERRRGEERREQAEDRTLQDNQTNEEVTPLLTLRRQ